MDEAEMLFFQHQEQEARRKEEDRKIDALNGGRRRLRGALFRDVGRWLLSMDPAVNPAILLDEDALLELLLAKLNGTQWRDRPPDRLDFESGGFRALVTMLALQIETWIAAEREACAKIADRVADNPHEWDSSSAGKAGKAIAFDIRARGQQ